MLTEEVSRVLLILSSETRRRRLLLLAAVAVIVVGAHVNIVPSFAAQILTPSPSQSAQPPASQPSPSPNSDWSKTIDSSQKIITALGIIIGGLWAYIKFFRGRTFRPRLELTNVGKVIRTGPIECLLVKVQLKNVGLSIVKLSLDLTYVEIYLFDTETAEPEQELCRVPWDRPLPYEVFQDHGWIEPGETITDELLFQLPQSGQITCRVDLIVSSRGRSWLFFKSEGLRWNSKSVVERKPIETAKDLSETADERT